MKVSPDALDAPVKVWTSGGVPPPLDMLGQHGGVPLAMVVPPKNAGWFMENGKSPSKMDDD